MVEANRRVIERFYRDLWNRWDLTVADEIVAEHVRFRGSLGTSIAGRDAFKRYVASIREAFPDWHNQVDEVIACGDRVVTRMTWTGTHRGALAGVEPTGRLVTYVGVAIFRLSDGRIDEAWVVGDTQELWKALDRLL